MKKGIRVFAVLLIAVLFVPYLVSCDNKTQQENKINYEYTLNDDESGLILLKYTGSKTVEEITVPDKINGVQVKELDTDIFRAVSNLKKVNLPTSLIKIGKNAFRGLEKLKTINTDAVLYFDAGCFEDCQVLEKISFSSARTIGKQAFLGCKGLTEVVIPSTTKSISDSAFSGCTSLAKVVLPQEVKEICQRAFSGCTALSDIDLSNIVNLRLEAFLGCASLTGADLSSISILEQNAFSGCTALEQVTIGEDCLVMYKSSLSGCTNLSKVIVKPSGEWIMVEIPQTNPIVRFTHWMGKNPFADAYLTAQNSFLAPSRNDYYYAKEVWVKEMDEHMDQTRNADHLDLSKGVTDTTNENYCSLCDGHYLY